MAKLKNPTRRGFLGFMAAAPMAANNVAKDAAMKLTGAEVGVVGEEYLHDYGLECVSEKGRNLAKLQSLFRVGVPEWLRERVRRQHSDVHTIDPGIAVLRSVSLPRKFQMQREIQYRNGLRQIEDRVSGKEDAVDRLRNKLQQETGFWF